MALGYLLHEDLGLFLLRVGIGVVFLAHASPKLKTPAPMAKGLGWKSGQVVLLGLLETIGALSLILGVYAQIGAVVLACVMLGAIYYKIFRWKVPFIAMDKMGWEFDLVLLAGNLAILFIGSGAYALLS